nr:uncharacterized protein LOC126518310 [Dermacentor andersoni]
MAETDIDLTTDETMWAASVAAFPYQLLRLGLDQMITQKVLGRKIPRRGQVYLCRNQLYWCCFPQDVAISTTAGEDETSFEMHMEWLSCESRKGSPDEDQINERMALTCRQRISDITTNSIHEAKRKYPYMMSFDDFARLTKIDPSPCVAKGINKIVKMAEMKHIPCKASVMTSLEQAREMSPERLRTRHILTVAALRILSFNIKEVNGLSSLFVQEVDPSVPATPCIVVSGGDVVEADLLHIKVDREKLFTVKNGEEGLAAVLSAYWLFNIQYDRKLFNSLVVLERLFLGLTLNAPGVVATKFLNKVTKSEPC